MKPLSHAKGGVTAPLRGEPRGGGGVPLRGEPRGAHAPHQSRKDSVTASPRWGGGGLRAGKNQNKKGDSNGRKQQAKKDGSAD